MDNVINGCYRLSWRERIGFCSGDIRGFGVCMLIGLVTSTFSSVFVAAPVMLAWYRNKRPDFRKGADK